MLKKIKAYLIRCLVLAFLISCDSKAVYDEYQTLPNRWNKENNLTFTFEAPDTTKTYNLFVNLRNNKDYQFNNLYLITGLEYPNGKTYIDTLEYKMAAPDGTLLGTGFTDVKQNKLWYKGYNQAFKFSETGTYTFTVEQAMRAYGAVEGVEDLKGVTEVGFRVEKQ